MIKKYDDADIEAIQIVLESIQVMAQATLTALIAKGVLNQNNYENAADEILQLIAEEKQGVDIKHPDEDLK